MDRQLKRLQAEYEAHQQALLDAFKPDSCNNCHKPNSHLRGVTQSCTEDGVLATAFLCMECINQQDLGEVKHG